MNEISPSEALKKLSALCAKAEHSTGEMRDKMRRWGLSDKDQAAIIAKLVEHQYVDDERFARAFVRDKLLYNHWGERKIAQALWQKGIDGDIVRAALSEIGREEYSEQLRPLLDNKARSIKADSEYERRQKLIRFALVRGFSMDEIISCLDD